MGYKHILVAVDLTPASQLTINKAIAMAKNDQCKVSLVYVDVNKVVLTPAEKADLQKALAALAEQADYPVNETIVVVGDLHIKLAGIVKQTGIDLVVCGHHHGVLSRLLSSVPKMANAIEADLLVVYLDE